MLLRMLEEIDSKWVTRHAGPVAQWLADGADPEAHIYPVIEQQIASGQAGKARSMNYFTNAVMEAMGNRPGANGRDPEPGNAKFVTRAIERANVRGDADQATAITDAYQSGGWDAAEIVARRYLDRDGAPA